VISSAKNTQKTDIKSTQKTDGIIDDASNGNHQKDSFWLIPKNYYGWRWLPPSMLGLLLLLWYPAPGLAWIQGSGAGYISGHLNRLLFVALMAVPIIWSVRLRILSRTYVGLHTRSHSQSAPTLITEGPFAMVRNPLYLSNLTMALTLVLLRMSGSDLSIVFGILHVLFWGLLIFLHYQLVILQEESDLRTRFSQEPRIGNSRSSNENNDDANSGVANWHEWMAQTPRWFRLSVLWLPLKPLSQTNLSSANWKTVAREDFWTWIWQSLAVLLVLFFPALA